MTRRSMLHRSFSLSLLFALVCLLHICDCSTSDHYFDPSSVESTFEQVLRLSDESALAALGLSAISVAVVHNNQIIFSRGYGRMDPESRKLDNVPDGDSIYSIGTITKTFTATSVLRLYEEGKLELHNTNVNDYIHDFKPLKNELIGNYISWNGRPRIATNQSVTMHHLLTHTSGLDQRFSGIAAYGLQDQLPLSSYIQRGMPPRVRQPGVVATFSQHGSTLMGLVVQEIVGEHYADHIQKELFDQLEMNDTYYGYYMNMDSDPNFVKPFMRQSDGGYIAISDYGRWLNIAPAAAIYSTANDMAKWAITHLNYGYNPHVDKRILKQETAKMMYSKQFGNREGVLGYGYMFDESMVNGVRFVSHTGQLSPYYSSLSLFHDHNVSLILLTSGTQKGVLEKIRAKFIEKTMLDYKLCADPDEYMDPATGFCLRTVLKSSVKPITKDYVSRWNRYEGCYITANHVHTGFFKALMISDMILCVRRNGYFLTVSSLKQTLIEVDLNLFTINYDNILDDDGRSYLFDITNTPMLSFLDGEGIPLDLNNKTNESHAKYIVVSGASYEYIPSLRYAHTLRSIRDLFIILLSVLILSSGVILCGCATRDACIVKNICQDYGFYGAGEEYLEDDIFYDRPYNEMLRIVNRAPEETTKSPPTARAVSCTIITTGTVAILLLFISILNLTNLVKVTKLRPDIHFVSYPVLMSMPFIAVLFAAIMTTCLVPMLVMRCWTRTHFAHWFSIALLILIPPTLLINIFYMVFISFFNIFLY